ncbi:uncharacterized protein LOC128208815 isoform X2 [Mya arenaria]|uniref:uncharacterized protein LOC128208815 isoform X2 n=1 Tax=Mya arenaria TaxID=6604 RepID=UPI0022E84394|nr:uncharacterized protein LOC128208815 isoform X2 [Mya arenaria]
MNSGVAAVMGSGSYINPAERDQGGNRFEAQKQDQVSLQRSKEASKQMLYGVFCNVIAILEEFEQRERPDRCRPLESSRLKISDQRRKSNEDIKHILETQLLLFEKQSNSCPAEVRNEVVEELKKKVLQWAGFRADENCEDQRTDIYVAQLYEILVRGKSDHNCYHRPSPEVSERTIQETMPYIMSGKHDQMELDREFKDNRAKTATCPYTRRSRNISGGAARIVRGQPDLNYEVGRDLQRLNAVDMK